MSFEPSSSRGEGLLCAVFTESETPVRFVWQGIQVLMIVLSSLSMLLENYEPYSVGYPGLISGLELLAVGVFTLDYLGSLYFAEDRVRHIFGIWALIDLASILPTFLLMMNPTSTLVVKSLRLLRFARLLRVWRMAQGA